MAERDDDFPKAKALSITALVGTLMLGISGAWVVAAGSAPIDDPAHHLARSMDSGGAAAMSRALTHFGDAPLMYGVTALVTVALFASRNWLEASVLGLGMLLTIAFVRLGKSSIDRLRPLDDLTGAQGQAFPSGHSAYAFAWVVMAVILVRIWPRLGGRRWPVAIAAVIAILVPLTRVHLRAHWLSDTIGGTGAAMLSFSVVALTASSIARRSAGRMASGEPPG